MFDINLLFEFSRNYCIEICAFMVPASFLLTLWTVLLVGQNRSQAQVQKAAIVASFFALVLLVHTFTWFVVGVILPPSYILLTLAFVYLSLNGWAIVHPNRMSQTLHQTLNQLSKAPMLTHLQEKTEMQPMQTNILGELS